MINFFDKTPDAGMAGCKVLNPDGSLQLACRRGFPGPWTSFTKLSGLSSLFPKSRIFARYNLTYLDENETYEVDAVSGSFMMIRREVYEKTGGFDPQFFMYGEDLDLCYRTQQAGYMVYYVHSTEIIHYKGESTKRSSLDETNVFYKAMHLFVKKHFTSSYLAGMLLQSAIIFRKLFAFGNLYSLIIIPLLADAVLFGFSTRIAEYIYSNDHWIGFPVETKPYVYILPALFQTLVSLVTYTYRKNSLSILRMIISLVIGFVLLASITFFLKQFAFSRAVLLITYLAAFLLFISWRIVAKLFFKYGLSDVARKSRTLLVGFGAVAGEITNKLKANVNSYHNIVGLIESSPEEYGKEYEDLEVLGTIVNLRKVVIDKNIDEVIFSADKIGYEQMFSAISDCQGTKVEFMVTGHELDFMVGKSIITMLDNMPFVKVQYNISSSIYRFSKWLLDKVLSVSMLILLYPLLLVTRYLFRIKGGFTEFVFSVPKVLIGKKSFIGPRKKSYHGELFLGKAGLTGLWFIEDVDENSEEDELKLNLFYAKNMNVWMDLEILGNTLSKIFMKVNKK